MAGCKSDFVSTTVDKPAATDFGSSMAPTNPRPTEDATARVGQPVTIEGNDDGSKIQVTALKVVNTKPTDQLLTVDQGKRLLAVQFKLVNTGTAPYADAPGNGAKVVDAQGQQYAAAIMFFDIGAGPMLPASMKIAPGHRALGYLAFQVPKSAKVSQVQFAMDSGFGETAQWNTR